MVERVFLLVQNYAQHMPVSYMEIFTKNQQVLRNCLVARGYFRSSQGNPDEARAARYILKDYVNVSKIIQIH